jgi:iron complex transport system substrate-binding protein
MAWLAIAGCAHREHAVAIVPKRIVSLAPSITETLFSLGLGDRVVGVTTRCHFPPKADSIEKIGDYADANLEKIISLHPDLAVLCPEHEKQRLYLERFHVQTLTIANSTYAEVCSSFVAIGRRCGAVRAADSLVALFSEHINTTNVRSGKKQKVLFCVGRDSPGGGKIRTVYVAARKTFYSDLLDAAGAENAFTDSLPSYPRISPEGILSLAPDVIIDIAAAMGNYSCDALAHDWLAMDRVVAVKNCRVYCLAKEYATVPGPRLLLLLDDIRKCINGSEKGGR